MDIMGKGGIPLVLVVMAAMLAGAGPVRLFDGATLKGWTALGNGVWNVRDGAIAARHSPSDPDFSHLVHDSVLKDFRASFLFRSVKGNAGFFFRLQKPAAAPDSVAGIQVVIDPALQSADAFGLYETGGRNWLRKWDYARHRNQYPGAWYSCFLTRDWQTDIVTDTVCRKTLYRPGEWNRISVWAKGPRIIVKLNMRTIADIEDASLDRTGRFAFELHGGQDVEIHFKEVELSPFPGLPPGLRSKLQKALLYKGEPHSPPPMREFVKEIAVENGFILDEGVEAAFTKANLAGYQVALFLSEYNINFSLAQRTDFEAWFKADHGALCLHACTRQEVSNAWPWWGEALGARLAGHTWYYNRTLSLDKEAERRPAWSGFDASPQTWRDEWFHWVENPRGRKGVTVLLSYADSGPAGNPAPAGLPYAWVNTSEGGRFFASGAAHTMNFLESPFTYDFLLNAMRDMAGYDTVATEAGRPGNADSREPRLIQSGGILRVQGDGPFSIQIRDASGKPLFQGGGDDVRPLEFLPPFSSGILFLTIKTGGRLISRRIVLAQGKLIGIP